MKYLFRFALCLIWAGSLTTVKAQVLGSGKADSLRVMTFNIRYDNPSDGRFAWKNRMPVAANMIRLYSPGIIGMQEVLKNQLVDLKNLLPGYGAYGVGRDDGREAGEYCPVFYNRSRFHIKDSGTIWLSELPHQPGSRSWGSGCSRIVTWVNLLDTLTRENVFVFNTHFDNSSAAARRNSAGMLLRLIREKAPGHCRVIVTGDFNDDNRSFTYRRLTTSPDPPAVTDTRSVSLRAEGPSFTFVGFPYSPRMKRPIDHIFISSRDCYGVADHQVITYHEGELYPSDHLPVMVILFEGKQEID